MIQSDPLDHAGEFRDHGIGPGPPVEIDATGPTSPRRPVRHPSAAGIEHHLSSVAPSQGTTSERISGFDPAIVHSEDGR